MSPVDNEGDVPVVPYGACGPSPRASRAGAISSRWGMRYCGVFRSWGTLSSSPSSTRWAGVGVTRAGSPHSSSFRCTCRAMKVPQPCSSKSRATAQYARREGM